MSIQNFFSSMLPHRMKRQVREMLVSTILLNLALAMVTIFEPIYLYQLGYSLQQIIFFYLLVYVPYLLIMPMGAKFARAKGYEWGIFVGSLFFALFYVSLFLVQAYPWMFYLAPLVFAVQKMFYWPAYHAGFAKFSDDSEEGREISAFNIGSSLMYIIGPALAGFIIYDWGYGALFTMASIIFLLSNIPTLVTKEKFEYKNFSYWQAYKDLFSKENRRSLFAYLGFGEELIVMVIWPIFISIIIVNVFDLGLIVALATLITVLITLYVGKLSDSKNKRSVLDLGSAFYSIAWFIRIFVVNQMGVFFVDTMSRLAKNIIVIPLMTITYERAKKRSVMETAIFFEMSLVVGKLIAILAIYAALFFITDEIFAMKLTFILAGSMSLLYMLL
ncbi:MFS transporter [Candidatus Nomurabacteria bacterium]|nr:MFS transporter [Candidatus Nomurabacteria bacterium]